MRHLFELQASASDLIAELEKINDKPRRSRDDEARYGRVEAQLEDTMRDLSQAKIADAEYRSANGFRPAGSPPILPGQYRYDEPDETSDATELRPEQRMADWSRRTGHVKAGEEKLSFRKYLRGILTSNWDDADAERRALAEGTNSAGGYTVPAPLSAELIDLARNQMQVVRAGATTIPMDSQTLKYARLASDVTAAWRNESAQISPSDPTFGLITFTARSLASHTIVSRELLEDTVNAEDALYRSFAASLALELDRAALRGSGTPPEPRGILNQSGVTVTALGSGNGANISLDDLITKGIGPVQDNNEVPSGIVWANRTGRFVAELKDANGNPLTQPGMLSSLPQFSTKQIPITTTVGGSTDTSEVYVADWSKLLIGVRHTLEVLVLQERYADFLQVGFVCFLRADIQLARPGAFAVITGVRGTA